MVYLIIILLGAVDFWYTKNISGRILVGLRWWNEVKEDGKEVWIFESKNEKTENQADRTVFWVSLYVNGGAWAVFFLYELLTLSVCWCIVSLVMLVFGGINLYGYFRCSKDQQKKLKGLGVGVVKDAGKKMAQAAFNNVKNVL